MFKTIANLVGYGTSLYVWCYGITEFSHTHPGWTGLILVISAWFISYKLIKPND